MSALIVTGIVLFALPVVRFAYRSLPIISQDWRTVLSGDPKGWRHNQTEAKVVVWVVKRFRFAKLHYETLGGEHRVRVGDVAIDDPEFDERLVELRFKAEELRRRLRAAA